MEIIIRPAIEGDIPRLTEIYNHHIEHGHSTFQLQLTTNESQLESFKNSSLTGPYQTLVATRNETVLGKASSFRYRDGKVFEKTVETGIYLDPQIIGQGVGTLLYQSLFDRLSKENLHLAVAGIALPNNGSVGLHRKMGYREVGVFDEYAYVKGKYYSSVWMQKRLDIC